MAPPDIIEFPIDAQTELTMESRGVSVIDFVRTIGQNLDVNRASWENGIFKVDVTGKAPDSVQATRNRVTTLLGYCKKYI